MIRLEVRNMAPALLARYLVEELDGVSGEDDTVSGAGWSVRFVPGEPALVGRDRVAVLFVEVDGPHAEAASQFLRQKTMRGGG